MVWKSETGEKELNQEAMLTPKREKIALGARTQLSGQQWRGRTHGEML